MRNGKHYVSVRMTSEEKDRFISIAKQCNIPERTLLYWLVEKMPVREFPPKSFWRLNRLLLRVTLEAGSIWLNRNLPKEYEQEYYNFSHVINKCDCNITHKIIFADPDYGNKQSK